MRKWWKKGRSERPSNEKKELKLEALEPEAIEERIDSLVSWSRANEELIRDLQVKVETILTELSSCKNESSPNLLQARLSETRNDILKRQERGAQIQYGLAELSGRYRQMALEKDMKNASSASLDTIVTNAQRVEADLHNVMEELRESCVLADKWASKWHIDLRNILYVQMESLENGLLHLDKNILNKRFDLFLQRIRTLRREAGSSSSEYITSSSSVSEVVHDIDGVRHVVHDLQQSMHLSTPQTTGLVLSDIDTHIMRFRKSRFLLYEETLHKIERAFSKVEEDLSTSLHSIVPLE